MPIGAVPSNQTARPGTTPVTVQRTSLGTPISLIRCRNRTPSANPAGGPSIHPACCSTQSGIRFGSTRTANTRSASAVAVT
jgi:hypothetical protein